MPGSRHRYFSLEGVLQDMAAAMVLVEVGTGSVLYANASAERNAFAFRPSDGHAAYDEHGVQLRDEALPHALAAQGRTTQRRVIEFRSADGAPVWLLFHSHVIEDGKVAVLTFEDVSPLHHAQTQLREALSVRDELVSMASHELRSPIGALALAVEQICRKSKQLALDEIHKLATLGQRQVHRLNVLVGNLLDVSRLRAGRFELDREPVRLGDVISEACEPLRNQAAAQKTPFECHIACEASGNWDVMRMDQVVTNLVTNALKYGGGKPVRVRLEAAGEHQVALSVEDDGPGIPAEQHARIFEPFERASARFKAQSLGLGLYIVSEIVRAHGGTIEVESEPGRTRFTILLPVTH